MEGVKVAVYDAEETLLGYKADSSWNLTRNPTHAKVQSPTAEKRAQLTRNLLHVLNKGGLVCKTDPRLLRDKLVVVTTSLDGEEVARQEICKTASGEYSLVT